MNVRRLPIGILNDLQAYTMVVGSGEPCECATISAHSECQACLLLLTLVVITKAGGAPYCNSPTFVDTTP